MYFETSSNNHGSDNTFVAFERTDIVKIIIIPIYYDRFSILTNDSWSTQYIIPKSDRYSDPPSDWTLVNLRFTLENYGFIIIHVQIDTPLADLCFSNNIITHSVY